MKIYHGTNKDLSINDLDARYNINNTFGPGIYFTEDIETAKSYGDNIITLEIDESKLVDGFKYNFNDINVLRKKGYIGALINLYGIVRNVLIWNMDDIRKENK